jgi:choline dehydrogenase-like flavoprotein
MEGLSPRAMRIAVALAKAAIPGGGPIEGGGERTAGRIDSWLAGASKRELQAMEALMWSAELAAVPATGRRLTSLSERRARRFLQDWEGSGSAVRRAHLRAVLTPIKAAHFDDPVTFSGGGCPHPSNGKGLPVVDERARWTAQVTNGREIDEDLELECEVVVVGTGAGGAACAYELARRGRAVLLLEEGDYHRRSSFNGRAQEMSKRLYRGKGLTMSVGNTSIPIWAGRAVGGSTVINSGTCYRAPDRVLRRWAEAGLPHTPETMAPYYDRVAEMLQIAPAEMAHVGNVGTVIARGAEKLGYSHGVLMRNAPGCDGQGVCCFGCPTGAKRSTDVSYIPEALLRGAQLVTAAKVTGIDVVAGRARGVHGKLGSGRAFTVKADAVVIAGGALMTPVVLRKAGVCTASPFLGKNLSIHPASKVMALFREHIDMANAIPQGYCVDQFEEEGMMLEGASTPFDVTAVAIPWVGRRYVEVMERYRHLATFGFMIEDTSRGEIRPGPGGLPLITYNMNEHDVRRMARGMSILAELFLAAGADRVLTFLPGAPEVFTQDGARAIADMKLKALDFEITAYHPLGTCRVGVDPKTSVCGPDHETHEVQALYVVDGSSVPSALGVNPQMTIMAMALRAGELLDARLG